jgi:hypothetical protein
MTRKASLPYLMQSGGRWYFRRGRALVRLPDPSDAGFLDAYNAAKKGRPKATRTSIGALIDEYQRSPRWDKLAPRTRADYAKVLNHIRKIAGGAGRFGYHPTGSACGSG